CAIQGLHHGRPVPRDRDPIAALRKEIREKVSELSIIIDDEYVLFIMCGVAIDGTAAGKLSERQHAALHPTEGGEEQSQLLREQIQAGSEAAFFAWVRQKHEPSARSRTERGVVSRETTR